MSILTKTNEYYTPIKQSIYDWTISKIEEYVEEDTLINVPDMTYDAVVARYMAFEYMVHQPGTIIKLANDAHGRLHRFVYHNNTETDLPEGYSLIVRLDLNTTDKWTEDEVYLGDPYMDTINAIDMFVCQKPYTNFIKKN